MNAYRTFPAPPGGLVAGLIYRIATFLTLCIRASGLGTTPALTSHTRARIVASVARLPAVTRNFARLAERAPRGTPPVRYAGLVARRFRRAKMASFRLATLIQAPKQVAREVRWLARGCSVVLPAGCFPTADNLVAEALATVGELAGGGARAARGGHGPRSLLKRVENA